MEGISISFWHHFALYSFSTMVCHLQGARITGAPPIVRPSLLMPSVAMKRSPSVAMSSTRLASSSEAVFEAANQSTKIWFPAWVPDVNMKVSAAIASHISPHCCGPCLSVRPHLYENWHYSPSIIGKYLLEHDTILSLTLNRKVSFGTKFCGQEHSCPSLPMVSYQVLMVHLASQW